MRSSVLSCRAPAYFMHVVGERELIRICMWACAFVRGRGIFLMNCVPVQKCRRSFVWVCVQMHDDDDVDVVVGKSIQRP